LHEPLVPGPNQTALLVKSSPMVGTFHAAGDSAAYRYLRPMLRWGARRLDLRCAVSAAAAGPARRYLGGDYTLLSHGIETDLWAKADPWPTDGPTVLFVGRHEPRKGLDVLLAALPWLPADARVWVAGEGPDTDGLRHRYAGDPRLEWLGRIDDDEKFRRM